MDPDIGPVNDDQPQAPAGEDPSLAWPMPPGGFAAAAPPPPRPVSRLRHRAILTAETLSSIMRKMWPDLVRH